MELNDLLRQTVAASASDLHLAVGLPPMVRTRGRLQPLGESKLTQDDTARLAYSMFKPYHKERFESTWELDLSYVVPDTGRFRVNVFRQRGSIGVAARVIPEQVPAIEDLNLPPILKELTRKPRGLILMTGPTGQGKSTTLASMIDFINHDRVAHIMMIEDPIEYVFPHRKSMVNQRELGNDTQSFPNALRAVLREDPNVIVVGEMRDLDTIATTLTIAETGHLVFATLHTSNAAQSIDRIVDVFPSVQQSQIRVQLASVLEAVLSQQLLPMEESSERAVLAGEPEDAGTPRAAPDAVGLPAPPGGPGPLRPVHVTLRGRIPAVEIMIATPAIRNLIREGKTHQIPSALQTGSQFGMQSMDQALLALYKRGLISSETAVARAVYPEDLRRSIGREWGGIGEAMPGLRP